MGHARLSVAQQCVSRSLQGVINALLFRALRRLPAARPEWGETVGRRWKTMLLAAALTVAGVAGATPAQAATCTITNFSPRSVVVGLTPVTATFNVSTSGCTRSGWDVLESEYSFYAYDRAPQWTFNPYSNSQAGAKDVIVTADSSDWTSNERVFADGFNLRRRTTWQSNTFNASPEPVRKGAPVSIVGRLIVADWNQHKYVPYASRKVAVQFRTPTGTYKTVKTVPTNSDGWVRTTVPASVTGIWRLSYGGNTVAGPAVVVGDSVQVVG
jgi:hypothetical protein